MEERSNKSITPYRLDDVERGHNMKENNRSNDSIDRGGQADIERRGGERNTGY